MDKIVKYTDEKQVVQQNRELQQENVCDHKKDFLQKTFFLRKISKKKLTIFGVI